MQDSGAVVPGGLNTIMMVLDLKSQAQLFPGNLEQLRGLPWLVQKLEATTGQPGSCVVIRKDGKPLDPSS